MTVNFDTDELVLSLQLSDESPAHFLTFIAASGNDRKSKEYNRLTFLIKSKRDIREWFKYYDGNIDNISEATDKLKESKIKSLNLSVEKFLVECVTDLKIGLELLFQEECTKETSEKIRDKLHSEELTLKKIYKIFKTNDWYTSASKIARASWN
jgi:hypothetical protein